MPHRGQTIQKLCSDGEKMKALILVDKLNWAYHSIAQSIAKYNHTDIQLKIQPIKGSVPAIKKIYKKYDLVFVMGWQTYELVNFIPQEIVISGVHSFHSWDDRKTTPDKSATPPKKLIRFLRKFRAVNTVSDRLREAFSKNGLSSIVYTANGVDTDIFKSTCQRPLGKNIIVGYSGSKAHDWRKGVSKYIIPAAKKAKAGVKLAMLSTGDYIPLDKMHTFYNQLDCYVCASSSEGMSLSVLEAAACGCPVITTRCSGNTEIIKEGITGFFVNRKVESIADKIEMFRRDRKLLSEMSNNVAEDVKNMWGWDNRASKWMQFIEDNIYV